MICEDLRAAGLGRPEEWFLKWQGREDPPETTDLQEIFEQGSSDNGVFSVKLMASHIHAVNNHLFRLKKPSGISGPFAGLRNTFKNPVWVWIRRRDTLGQAISHYLAKTTGIYHVVKRSDGFKPGNAVALGHLAKSSEEISFDFDAVLNDWREIQYNNLLWGSFFEATKIRPFEIWYEDYTGLLPQAIGDRLGIELKTSSIPRNVTKMPQERAIKLREKFIDTMCGL